jgi:hypothetical protein
MLHNSQAFQTTGLTGGSPLRLICGATNEWQISLGAVPHARHNTSCWFLDHDCKLQNISKDISKDHCRLQTSNINHGDVLVLSDCSVLVFVQIEGKVKALGTWKWKKSAIWNWQNNLMNNGNVRLAYCLRLVLSDWCVLVCVHTWTKNCSWMLHKPKKIHASRRKMKIEIKFHTSIVLEWKALPLWCFCRFCVKYRQ